MRPEGTGAAHIFALGETRALEMSTQHTALEVPISAQAAPRWIARDGLAGGRSSPLGATVHDGGVNFSVYSRAAVGMDLLLFDHDDDARPARLIRIDPFVNRTHHYWHVFIPGVQPGQMYAYRVRGPWDEVKGLRFD